MEAISSTKTWSPKPELALLLAKEKFTRLISRLHLKITSVIYFKTIRLDKSRSNGRLGFALCSASACEQLPTEIVRFSNDMYTYVSNSAKQLREYNEFQKFCEVAEHALLYPSQLAG